MSVRTCQSHEREYVHADKILEFHRSELESEVLDDDARKFVNSRIEKYLPEIREPAVWNDFWTTDQSKQARENSARLPGEWLHSGERSAP